MLQLYRLNSPLPTARHLLIRLMGHLVRRRYSQKQPCRTPAELVPLSQPLAAQLVPLSQRLAAQLVLLSQPSAAQHVHPNKKRTWAGSRVQLCGLRIACSISQQEALRERLRQARASRQTWTPEQWERVVKEIGAEDWGARAAPRKRLRQERAGQETLLPKQWVVQQIGEED